MIPARAAHGGMDKTICNPNAVFGVSYPIQGPIGAIVIVQTFSYNFVEFQMPETEASGFTLQ